MSQLNLTTFGKAEVLRIILNVILGEPGNVCRLASVELWINSVNFKGEDLFVMSRE